MDIVNAESQYFAEKDSSSHFLQMLITNCG